jgi:molybdenum cofactor guanylyltransferase
MNGPHTTATAILAGGRSRRMGQDKALLSLAGRTLLQRTAALAAPLGPVLVCGRAAPEGWADSATVFLLDAETGTETSAGPLAGVLAALRWAADHGLDRVAVVPCDLPRLDAAAMEALHHLPNGDLGAVLVHHGEPQPLAAIYRTAVLPQIAHEAGGRRSLRSIVHLPGFLAHQVPDHAHGLVDDADTPEAWQRLAGDT